MNTLTPNEAKNKKCVMALKDNCIGDLCMGWKKSYDVVQAQQVKSSFPSAPQFTKTENGKGSCGMTNNS